MANSSSLSLTGRFMKGFLLERSTSSWGIAGFVAKLVLQIDVHLETVITMLVTLVTMFFIFIGFISTFLLLLYTRPNPPFNFSARFHVVAFFSCLCVLLMWISYFPFVHWEPDKKASQEYFTWLHDRIRFFLLVSTVVTSIFAGKSILMENLAPKFKLNARGESHIHQLNRLLTPPTILSGLAIFVLYYMTWVSLSFWVALVGQAVVIGFVHGNLGRKVFEGIVFVTITKPFDIGDICVVADMAGNVTVYEIGFLTTGSRSNNVSVTIGIRNMSRQA